MAMKVQIVSTANIKPSTPTPHHLRRFNLCLLDELAPPSYVPILLLYASHQFNAAMSESLKSSLSETLALYYPFCGTLRGNLSVDCNDNGALFVETRVDVSVMEIAENPETELLYKLFPLDPYRTKMEEEAVVMAVQVNVFRCGGVGIGVCVAHKVADGTTMAAFLHAWAATATGADQPRPPPPRLDSALIFPPKGVDLIKQSDMIRNDKIVTKRFEFSGENLTSLKSKISAGNTTRVEAVTALIWKSAMEAKKQNSGEAKFPPAIATHLVNIRGRAEPPLPENTVGNLWRLAVAPYKGGKDAAELQELVKILKEKIRRIDGVCINELKGEKRLEKAIEPLKEMREMAMGGEGVEVYTFSSWTRFGVYEVELGWGRPEKVCTITVPVRNSVILVGREEGIEAWVTLTEEDMKVFEMNEELLQFVSTNNR